MNTNLDHKALFQLLKKKKVDIEWLMRTKYCEEYNYGVIDKARYLSEEDYKTLKEAFR